MALVGVNVILVVLVPEVTEVLCDALLSVVVLELITAGVVFQFSTTKVKLPSWYKVSIITELPEASFSHSFLTLVSWAGITVEMEGEPLKTSPAATSPYISWYRSCPV